MPVDWVETSFAARWRLTRGVCRGAVLLVALLAFAISAVAEPMGEISGYKLAPGDRITITVVGQTEMSGDFPVDGTGQILFPLLGLVDVGNLTLTECQKRIVELLSAGFLQQPSVFVRITEMRPILVLGDVKTPGSYPYRYGSLVKSVVAMAGGFGLSQQSPGAAAADFFLADERLRVLETARWRLLNRQARLKAQLSGALSFARIVSPASMNDGDAEKLNAEELDALSSQTEAFAKQLELLRGQKPSLESEIEAVNGQIASEKKQIDLIRQQVETYEKLARGGLTRLDSLIQLQLSEAAKESNIWRLEADRSRLKMNLGELDIRVQEAHNSYNKQISNELQDISQRLHDVAVTLPSAREVREIKQRESGGILGAAVKRDFTITRSQNAEFTTIQANEMTVLEPGDILEIRAFGGTEGRSSLFWANSDAHKSEKKPQGAAGE